MRRILVASDLTQNSANALARAIKLAARGDAQICIVHAAVDEQDLDACAALHRKIGAEAGIMAEELTGRSLDFTVRISPAAPGHAIVREAEMSGADLVVLGGHGEPRFRDVLFGTTATYVIRHAECPILVVQQDAAQTHEKILVAVDNVGAMQAILAPALEIAPAAEIFAVHAFEPSWQEALEGGGAIKRQEVREELEIEKVLGAALAGRSPAPASAERHAVVRRGEALEVIMNEAKAIEPQLLVMGTRHRASFLGSHAVDTLFWCPYDILIVPERQAAAQGAV